MLDTHTGGTRRPIKIFRSSNIHAIFFVHGYVAVVFQLSLSLSLARVCVELHVDVESTQSTEYENPKTAQRRVCLSPPRALSLLPTTHTTPPQTHTHTQTPPLSLL